MRDSKRGTIEDPSTDAVLALAFEQQKQERLLAEASVPPSCICDDDRRDDECPHHGSWRPGQPTVKLLREVQNEEHSVRVTRDELTVSRLITNEQSALRADGAKLALSILVDELRNLFGASGAISVLDLSLVVNSIIDRIDTDSVLSGR